MATMTGGTPGARLGLARPGRAWLALAGLLALGSALALTAAPDRLDWQPPRVAAEPWRAWTAALVHGSAAHLGANLGALLLLAVLGWRERAPAAAALAWALAWPATQLGWLLGPPLAHFFGLSGVLHAGLAVLALQLLWRQRAVAPCSPRLAASALPPGRKRLVGALLLLGLALKLALEEPFGPVLRPAPALGIAVAPWSHWSGSVAGLACLVLVWGAQGLWQRLRLR